jgi:hypothetical protein
MSSYTLLRFPVPIVQVPAAILCTRYWRHDLIGLYAGMALGFGIQVVLFTRIVLLR